ncbi:ROK family protein [Saccharopolyspora sp. NPDC000995]
MLTIGVDVGGTSARAGVVDQHGETLETHRVPTPATSAELNAAIVDTVRALSDRYAVAGVGLAVAGFVSEDRRVVRFAPHLAWRHVTVADELADRLGLPVFLEHDANAAAVAEQRFGAATGARVAALVAIGTGIGGALMINGEVFRGAYGIAPELGHLRVVPDGRPCSCGKRGCWERYCSGTALAATAAELRQEEPGAPVEQTGVEVALAAEAGDPVARRAVADLARWLGEGLALVADVYDPEVVVIAGGVCDSAHLFLDDAREYYATAITGAGHRPLARIAVAHYGDSAAMIGSAALAREHALTEAPHLT